MWNSCTKYNISLSSNCSNVFKVLPYIFIYYPQTLFLKAWQRQSVLGLGLTHTLPGGKTLQLAQWNLTSPQIQAAVLSRVSDTCLRIWPQPHSRWVWGSFLHLLPNWLLLLLLYIFGHLTDQDRVRKDTKNIWVISKTLTSLTLTFPCLEMCVKIFVFENICV